MLINIYSFNNILQNILQNLEKNKEVTFSFIQYTFGEKTSDEAKSFLENEKNDLYCSCIIVFSFNDHLFVF